MTYPTWVMDDSPIPDPHGRGRKAVAFLRALRHPKSTAPGGAIQFDRWHERLITRIYGDTDHDGRRRIRTVFLLTGRGARKSTLLGAVGCLHLLLPELRVPRGLIAAAAVDQSQAAICFTEARSIIEAHPATEARCHIRDARKEIIENASQCVFHAMSSDAPGKIGFTPNVALVDEICAWQRGELNDVIDSGLLKSPETLKLMATNAGIGRTSVGWSIYERAQRVASGAIEDPSFLPVIFDNPLDADWKNEATWRRANPSLDSGYPDIAGIRAMAREAEHRPGAQEAFRRFVCSQWLDAASSAWLEPGVWDALEHEAVEADFEGCDAFVAIDLARTTDLSAVVCCAVKDGKFNLFPRAFAPETTLAKRKNTDHIPADLWAKQGHLIATPGAVIEDEPIEEAVRDFCARFNVKEIVFDPWNAARLATRLKDAGLPVAEMRQGMATMGPAFAAFEKAVLGGTIATDGNPVLQWCVHNVRLKADQADNRMMTKAHSTGRIDVAVAACMAVGRATFHVTEPDFIYADAAARPNGIIFV